MHQHAMTMGNLCNLRDRLQRASLVVGVHDRDQHRLLIDSRLNISRTDPPTFVHGQIRDPQSMQSLKGTANIEDGGMLGDLGDDMLAISTPRQCCPTNGKVVAFRPSAGENDFGRCTAQQPGYLLPRHFYRLGNLSVAVRTRWVAEMGG